MKTRVNGYYFSLRRVGAMVLRYFYLLRGSLPRIVELAYWPTMQMLIWGFMSQFLYEHSEWFARAGGVLIAAVLLWDVMFLSNIGVSISFLEEMWSRNLGQLFASPLRPYEWACSLLAISGIRTLIGVVPASLLAIPLYHYSIFEMGLPLIAFFVNLLIFGAAVGLAVSGLVMRCGLGAESLAWAVIFALPGIAANYCRWVNSRSVPAGLPRVRNDAGEAPSVRAAQHRESPRSDIATWRARYR